MDTPLQESPRAMSSGDNAEESKFEKIKNKCLPGVRITLLISLIFYIAMFVIGIWGIHKCPVNENIPFFLIVTGGIGLFSKGVSIIRGILKQYPVQYVESSLYTVELVFLFFGSYWVFKVYKPSFYPSSQAYCNKTVYMFAFIYLAVLYAIMMTIFLCFCCFLGCIYYVKRTESLDVDPESPTSPIRESQEASPQN